jgi:hypothetical protein
MSSTSNGKAEKAERELLHGYLDLAVHTQFDLAATSRDLQQRLVQDRTVRRRPCTTFDHPWIVAHPSLSVSEKHVPGIGRVGDRFPALRGRQRA